MMDDAGCRVLPKISYALCASRRAPLRFQYDGVSVMMAMRSFIDTFSISIEELLPVHDGLLAIVGYAD